LQPFIVLSVKYIRRNIKKGEIGMIFRLRGEISYEAGSCADTKIREFDRKFQRDSVDEAIEHAKELVREFFELYKNRIDLIGEIILFGYGYGETQKIYRFRLMGEIEPEPAKPAIHIPAKKAKPGKPARIIGKKIK